VTDRHGIPAIARVRNRFGETQSQLKLKFRQARVETPNLDIADDGMSPVSWTAWLAELDRQQLALQIDGANADDFALVERRRTAN
jgi:hypothetical protein